jgi:hypothetical protein
LLGTAVVDDLGQWSLIPEVPLADNTLLRARSVDVDGNVSGPNLDEVDVNQIGLTIPLAADGYINAEEKASGQAALNISLPC